MTDGYRLISGRSQDRNLLPVYFNSAALQKQLVIAKRRQNTASFTGVAQRQRAGLITPRTQDQSLSPVYFNSAALQKQPVIAKRRQNTVSFTAVAQRLARRFTLWAHNSEVTRSKRVSGIILFGCFTEAARHS